MTSLTIQPKVTIQPAGGRVLVRKPRESTVSAGGIYLPDQRTGAFPAEIVALGPGRELPNGGTEPLPFKVGQRVLLHSGAGRDATTRVQLGDEQLLLVEHEQILAVYTDG